VNTLRTWGTWWKHHWEQLGKTHWERGGNTKIPKKANPSSALSQKENLQVLEQDLDRYPSVQRGSVEVLLWSNRAKLESGKRFFP